MNFNLIPDLAKKRCLFLLLGDIEVLVGEHDLMTSNDECQRIRISRIHEHPAYNKDTVAFDFSLIILAERLHFSK